MIIPAFIHAIRSTAQAVLSRGVRSLTARMVQGSTTHFIGWTVVPRHSLSGREKGYPFLRSPNGPGFLWKGQEA